MIVVIANTSVDCCSSNVTSAFRKMIIPVQSGGSRNVLLLCNMTYTSSVPS